MEGIMEINTFLDKLQSYHSEQVFNPWRDFDTSCDIGPQAPVIRSANLRRYLELRPDAHYLFIAEALGYQGGHFSGVACVIGDNDLLLTVRRREGKAACFVERDRRAVYGNGINVLFVNGDRLRLAVGLAILNAGNNGPNIVKRYTVRAEICYVQALVNKHCINNIFSVRLY